LFAVFEPRSATASRKIHQDVYPESFAAADVVLLARVARDLPADERLDVARVARDLRARGTEAQNFEDVDTIVAELARQTRAGDVVAVLSNGTFDGIYSKLLSVLAGRGDDTGTR
jgi:UDP-N-acetylmuramate: L-alanyl-gamma-D-glutamyl-meso-diaminopimelate ligase